VSIRSFDTLLGARNHKTLFTFDLLTRHDFHRTNLEGTSSMDNRQEEARDQFFSFTY
jgi:hypothetical protein